MDIKQFAAQQAVRYGLTPEMFLAQIKQESNWNTNAVSRVGAQGLGQIMPATAKELGVKNVNDPYENIEASARYMGQLKNRFGSEDYARLAYNWGQGNVASYLRTGKGAKGQSIPKEAEEYNTRIYSHAGKGTNDPMATMASYKPRRDVAQSAPTANNGKPLRGIMDMGIESIENELLSNPQSYAKKAFIEDMVASVPQQDPYTADLEMKLSKMFDETEILPKEYING
jgi:SLT domain-containing protein